MLLTEKLYSCKDKLLDCCNVFGEMIPISLNDRVEWVDTAKGIGIILVVLGHIWLMREGYNYIYSFHMPLFFFLSGYIVNFAKYDGLRQFIVVKLNGLVIPYFWFSFFTYLYWVLVERKFSGNEVSPAAAFINIFISPGADQYLPHNPALWFLTCLFIVAIAFYGMASKLKLPHIGILLLLSSAAGYAATLYLPSSFPWSIDVAPTAIVFYGMGFIIKKMKVTFIKSSRRRLWVLCCCVPAGFIISQLNGSVVMADNVYGNYLYFYLGASLGITNVVIIAMLFRKNRALSYLGQNSLIILALHFPIKRAVASLTSKVLDMPLVQMKESFLISGIDTVITILFLLPFIYLIRRQLSFMLGRRPARNRIVEGAGLS
ncbi:MAG: acyltransferase family protein [Veillonellales bacterium]